MKLRRNLAIILFICFLSVLIVACTSVAFAYFNKKQNYEGHFSGQVELLFDRLNDEGVTAYQQALTAEGETVTVDKEATWGSKAYPYVISDVRHLYNLSELQMLGYFKNRFISQNPEGSYSIIPYFLVCTPEYTPALIDGSKFRSISTIGTEQFPFIGSVKGVKNTGSTITVNGKACDTSAICNVKVACDSNNIDVGLFGVIGYLGGDVTTDENGVSTFKGQVSTVSNLVLSDVQIEVKSKSLIDTVIEKFKTHVFSFSSLTAEENAKVPHENHHIGILAGHAQYARIEFISVYYSSNDMVAMNVADATTVDGAQPNYLSATGILGFIDNLNPTVEVEADGSQSVTAGSGDSLGDLSYSPVGGGGEASGNKAGYVLAGEMYAKYHYAKPHKIKGDATTPDSIKLVDGTIIQANAQGKYELSDGTVLTEQEDGLFTDANGNIYKEDDYNDGTIFLKDALDENGNALCTEWVRDRILWGTENTGEYYFYDGVFTFALSDQADVIEPTWNIKTDESGTSTYDVPQFSIGQNDPAKWKTNTSHGNKAAVAYVKEIKSLAELNAQNGKDIFILGKNADGSAFLMTLYNESKSNFDIQDTSTWGDNNYTTSGMKKSFASDLLVSSLIESIEAGNEETPSLYDGMTTELRNKTLKVINLGTAEDLTTLQNQYKIRVTSQGTAQNASFTFSTTGANNKTNNLGLIIRYRIIGIYNNIYCGNNHGDFSAYTTTANLTYSGNSTDPYFTFKYEQTYKPPLSSENTYTRYVRYDATNSRFTSASNESESTRLYLYSIAGMSNINFGQITFDPIDDTASETDNYSFSAGEYVLYATPTHTRQNGTTGNITATTTNYEVKALKSDEANNITGLDWNNGFGNVLSQADLQSKFRMTKGISFGATFNLLNGSLGTSGIITAPVGSEGIEANIPQGCIAFRINKPVTDAKIRVIVSVAVSEYYSTEDGYNLGDYTRYYNLWKMEEAGESLVHIFNATGNNLIDRITIPRSHPYEPGTLPSDTSSEFINVSYNGTDNYRCYLNGDRVLIAYEFTVDSTTAGTGTGVYCLGMSGLDGNGESVGDVPMEIIYFSAEGVASTGRDGDNGSQIGTIDFVYDYNNKVVTVMESSATDANGKEDYNTYYPSYCLLFFKNTEHEDPNDANSAFIPVHTEVVKIRRYIESTADSDINHNDTPSLSTLRYDLTGGDGLVGLVQYSRFADNIRENGVALIE